MKTNKKSTTRNHPKQSKQDQNSSKTIKFFYVLMFLLIVSSSFIRVAGASRHPQSVTPTPQVNSAGNGGTATRVFVFHREDTRVGTCADLVIPAVGSAVYSNCGKGIETQYNLSNSEHAQLQAWISQFQPINNEHSVDSISTQLYLNGQGNQAASETDIQSMVHFAETLAVNIAS